MAFKADVSHNGKTYHLEVTGEELFGKKIGDTVSGSDISPQLAGTEFVITGGSDKAGLPSTSKVDGTAVKRVLLTKGFALWNKHKKKKGATHKVIKGLRKRRTLRGNTISADMAQVNLKMTKDTGKSLAAMLGKEEKPVAAEAPKAV